MSDEGYKPILLVDTSRLLFEERMEYYKLGLGPYDIATIYQDQSYEDTGYASVLGIFLDKMSRRSKEELDQMVEQRIRKKQPREPNEPELSLLGRMRRPVIGYGEEYDLTTGHSRALKYTMARYLSCRLGAPVYPVSELMQHPRYPFLIAKLDFVVVFMNPETGEFDHPVNLQCRTATHWKLDELGKQVPPDHELHSRVQMCVSGLDETILVYLCDNNEGGIVFYRIPRSRTLESKLIQCGKDFWCQWQCKNADLWSLNFECLWRWECLPLRRITERFVQTVY